MPKVKIKRDKSRPPRLSRQFLRDEQWVSVHIQDLIEKYPNQGIMVYNGEVIANGENVWPTWRNADELGLDQPVVTFIERNVYVYMSTQKEIVERTIKAYLAEDDAVPLLLGVEDLLTWARLVCDYPKSKAFLQA